LIHHRIIKPILTGWLLALFALAITPKIAIHALVAHHTDTHVKPDGNDQYSKAGFHCATDNLVVQLPFTGCAISVQLGLPAVYLQHPASMLETPLPSSHPLFGLRGPPAALCI
jgi:hypothetical protein